MLIELWKDFSCSLNFDASLIVSKTQFKKQMTPSLVTSIFHYGYEYYIIAPSILLLMHLYSYHLFDMKNKKNQIFYIYYNVENKYPSSYSFLFFI